MFTVIFLPIINFCAVPVADPEGVKRGQLKPPFG